MHEFDLIKNIIAPQEVHRNDVITGIGDDAAVVSSNGKTLFTCLAILNGADFREQDQLLLQAIRTRLAGLIDSMRQATIEPRWLTLALTLPDGDPVLSEKIAVTIKEMLEAERIELIGGDTTHGPFTMVMQLSGTRAS